MKKEKLEIIISEEINRVLQQNQGLAELANLNEDIVDQAFLDAKPVELDEGKTEWGVEYRDSRGKPKHKGQPVIKRFKSRSQAEKYATKGNQVDRVGGTYTVVEVPVQESSKAYGDSLKKIANTCPDTYVWNPRIWCT